MSPTVTLCRVAEPAAPYNQSSPLAHCRGLARAISQSAALVDELGGSTARSNW